MGLLCVMTDHETHLLYDEHDVMSVCKKMRCGHHAEDCRALMRRRAMECVLCHAALTALKKPCRAKTIKPEKGQTRAPLNTIKRSRNKA